ncbi:recombinase family protein [Streptomyces sp. NPDC085466]|uniref:recombinase family protein n=1 Tax=Streptomyces sp. NPDC085466 TaxID=3365725 RepID=UPI0037D4A78C
MDTVRVAVYARRSKTCPDSSEASLEAQVAAGEELTARGGWEVAHTFKDVGRSGWDPHVIRLSLEDLMSAVRAGEVDVVVDASSTVPHSGLRGGTNSHGRRPAGRAHQSVSVEVNYLSR